MTKKIILAIFIAISILVPVGLSYGVVAVTHKLSMNSVLVGVLVCVVVSTMALKKKRGENSLLLQRVRPVVNWVIGLTIVVILFSMQKNSEKTNEKMVAAKERGNNLLAVEKGVGQFSIGETLIFATSEGVVYENPGCGWFWDVRASPDTKAEFIVGWWDHKGYHELRVNKKPSAADVSIGCSSPRYKFRSPTGEAVELIATMSRR